MRIVTAIAALLLTACASTPPAPPVEAQGQRAIAMVSLVDSAVVHAFRTASTFASFDNQYPLTWNVSDLLIDATSEASSARISRLDAPQWLASADSPVRRKADGGYLLNRTTAGQIKRFCVAQKIGTIIIWLDDNQTRTVQGAQFELIGNGALEIDSSGVNPFIAYSSALGIGVNCTDGRVIAAARDNSMQRIANFRPPPGGLPQLELDKTRSYFESLSKRLASDLLQQLGIAAQ
jgi:hypothetical protein